MSKDDDVEMPLHQQPQSVRPSGPLRVVSISRPADVEEARSHLPIVGMEQEIMEGVGLYDVLVLCGETGCGKTTQAGFKGFKGFRFTTGRTVGQRVYNIQRVDGICAACSWHSHISRGRHVQGYCIWWVRRSRACPG